MDTHMTDASPLAAGFAMATPPAGAGVVTASVIMVAAGLCESLARTAEGGAEGRGLVMQAIHIRARADAALAANARAYENARQRLRPPAGHQTGRDAMLRAALVQAADTLLSIAGVAADCAALAAALANAVTPDLRPDAVAVAELAAGAVQGVAVLVEANLALPTDDVRRELAASLITMARDSCATARKALTG
jgi:formiminotetrahydrofolate cyclodeaminase